jgi:hypothetical protein
MDGGRESTGSNMRLMRTAVRLPVLLIRGVTKKDPKREGKKKSPSTCTYYCLLPRVVCD